MLPIVIFVWSFFHLTSNIIALASLFVFGTAANVAGKVIYEEVR